MTDSPRMALRAGTRAEHERLDAMMGAFRLSDRDSYRAFLTAHAMALPAVEAALDATSFAAVLEDWPSRRRTDALAADLATLDAAMPEPLDAPALATPAAQWGAAYVLEGSRLGGAFLTKQIGDGLPNAYLGTPQPPGNWRTFTDKLDTALVTAQDVGEAETAARAVFALFEAAARRVESV